MLKITNVERIGTLPGGVAMPFDRAIVTDTIQEDLNPITCKMQPKIVYRGNLEGAHEFVKAASK